MFSLKVRKGWKFLFFFKNYFPSNCFVEHPDCISDKLAKHFWKMFDKFLQIMYKNDEKIVYFTKKIIKTFPCRRKLRFWWPCWNVSARSSKKIRSMCGSRKKIVSFFQKKCFSSKCSSGLVAFRQSYWNISAESGFVFLLIMRKWWRACEFLQRESQNTLLEMLKADLWSLLESFAESANVFCSQSGYCKDYILFVPKKILKTFLSTRRIQFLQPCWNSFVKKRLKCCC